MTMQEVTISKIQQLPESFVQEVNDFIDFLVLRHNKTLWELWTRFTDDQKLSESDFSNYLPNLEDYENRLARGEIKW